MNDLSGQALGRYHLIEKLGEGGMAVVYKAVDTRLECEVAVKIIRTEDLPQSGVERALKRFEREAKAVAQLNHPNIVRVMDYGEQDGMPYLVMPYQPGGTLKELINERGQIPWDETVHLLIPIAEALGYAHLQGVIHRDVKPSNILLTQSGQPMLTDFGVAKVLEDKETQDLTGTSAAVGTPEYMAPEQITSKTVDGRADLYSLGVVFYEMITGRKPFMADTPMAVLFKHASDPLPRPTQFVKNLPQNVELFLLKTLAKEPENRYQTADDIKKTLLSLSDERIHKKNETNPPTEKSTIANDPHKNILMALKWWIIGGIALAAIALVVLLKNLPNKNSSTQFAEGNQIPTIQLSSVTPQPTSEVVSGALVTYKETFEEQNPPGWDLNGPISIENGQMILHGNTDAYFGHELAEGQSVLIRFKYTEGSSFALNIHNEEIWDGPTFRKFGIYDGNPFFIVVFEGGDNYLDTSTWQSGNLIPQPDHWYFLMITIGGNSEFFLRVWDMADPNQYVEIRHKMDNSWVCPKWHFRMGANTGEVTIEEYQELIYPK